MTTPAPEPKKRGRWRRRLTILLVFLLLLVVTLYFAIPAVLSSEWGRKRVEKALADSVGRPVAIASLDFGWTKGLTVRDFALGEGEDALRARALHADPELLSLLGDELRLRKVEMEGLDILVLRTKDGSFVLPALEAGKKEAERRPDGSDAQTGKSALGRISVVVAVTDVNVVVRDEVEGELLRFGPVAGEATLARGSAVVPITIGSEIEGFSITANLTLLEGDSLRADPVAEGTLEFAKLDLGRYAALAEVLGKVGGLRGAVSGKVEFRAEGAARLKASLDIGILDPAAADIALNGTGRISGSVERAGAGDLSGDLVVTLPGAEFRVLNASREGELTTVSARVAGSLAELRSAVTGVSLPEFAGRLDLAIEAMLEGGAWSARLDGTVTSPGGRALIEVLPGLGDRVEITGRLGGDAKLAALRIEKPLVLIAGPETVTITGEILRPADEDRGGRIEAAWRGPILRPALDSLADARLSGDGSGTVTMSFGAGRADLAADLTVANLLVAKPGTPEIREPRVTLRSRAGLAFDDKALSLASANLSAQGLTLVLSGPIDGLPGQPSGKAKLTVTGDLARIRPFLPSVNDLVPSGVLTVALDLTGNGDAFRASGNAAVRGLDLGAGRRVGDVDLAIDATLRPADDRLTLTRLGLRAAPLGATAVGTLDLAGPEPAFTGSLDFSSDLARVPAGLGPEGFSGRGTLTGRLTIPTPGRARLDVTGHKVTLGGLPGIEGVIRADRLALGVDLSLPAGATLPRIGNGRFEVPSALLTLQGSLDPMGPTGTTVRLEANLAELIRDVPGLFPKELAATGKATADLRIEGDLGKEDALGLVKGGGLVTISKAAWPGYTLEAGDFAFTVENERLRLTKGAANLNGGPATVTGGVDLGTPAPKLDLAVDTRGVRLSKRMEPQARFLAPVFGNATELSGTISLFGKLSTEGKAGTEFLNALSGSTRLSVDDGVIAGSPILSALLAWLGQPEDLRFTGIGGLLRFENGRVMTDDLNLSAKGVTIRFSGATGFDGSLDYRIGVKLPEGSKGAKRFESVLGKNGFIPIRLTGSFAAPELAPPKLEDMVEGALEGILKKKLGDLLK